MNAQAVAILTLIPATATPALASTGFNEGFSGVFIWVFLGYCAIIVLAQTVAAIRALLGLTKRSAGSSGTETQDV